MEGYQSSQKLKENPIGFPYLERMERNKHSSCIDFSAGPMLFCEAV